MIETIKNYKKLGVPHPIPYQGSKRNLAPIILSYFPANFKRLVEPFAGSAAVSLASAYKGLCERYLINDAHEALIDLWREIVDNPQSLIKKYTRLWQEQLGQERVYYDTIRTRFNATHKPAYFLYLLARCVKAAIRYNNEGQFNNSPDNRRKGAHPKTMKDRILGASLLLRGKAEFSSADYRSILEQCDVDDLIYMDPPYQGVCKNRDNRYSPKVIHEEFCDALHALNSRKCLFLVSYDGRTGERTYGEPLPKSLQLVHIEVHAGRSTQETLLGRKNDTFESLYLSPALAAIVQVDKKKAQLHFTW